MVGKTMEEKKELFGWFTKKYTGEEVKELLEEVKRFNCGAIDQYLTNHVDRAFEKWVEDHK
jgi:hypothetical protein